MTLYFHLHNLYNTYPNDYKMLRTDFFFVTKNFWNTIII